MFLIEGCWSQGEGIEEDDEGAETSIIGEEETSEISLHAMAGTQTPQTMKVKGYVGKFAIYTLVDSGSTHSFLREKLAAQ